MLTFARFNKINKFLKIFRKILAMSTNLLSRMFFRKKCYFRAVQRCALCRSRRELSNGYLLAKFGFDTAENEPSQVCPIPRNAAALGGACPSDGGGLRSGTSASRPRRTPRSRASGTSTSATSSWSGTYDPGGSVVGISKLRTARSRLYGQLR